MEENKQYTVFKFQRLFRSKWNQVSKLPLHHSLCTVCDICKSNLLRQKGSGSDRVICIYIFTWCQLMMKPAFSKWRQLRAALKKFQTGALCSAVPGKLVNDTPASVQIPFRNYTGSHLGCLTILFICLCCWLKDPMPLLDIATTWFHVVQCQVSEALGSRCCLLIPQLQMACLLSTLPLLVFQAFQNSTEVKVALKCFFLLYFFPSPWKR